MFFDTQLHRIYINFSLVKSNTLFLPQVFAGWSICFPVCYFLSGWKSGFFFDLILKRLTVTISGMAWKMVFCFYSNGVNLFLKNSLTRLNEWSNYEKKRKESITQGKAIQCLHSPRTDGKNKRKNAIPRNQQFFRFGQVSFA